MIKKNSIKLLDNPKKPKSEWVLFWLILPLVIWTIITCYIPIAGWSYAFIDYRLGRSPFTSPFVGLDNFKQMFSSTSRLPRALRNTLIPNLMGYSLCWLPVAFAICITELRKVWLRKTVQVITTIPNFISWVMVFGLMFALISNDGVINIWLLRLGLINKSINLLGNVKIAYILQTMLNTWKGLGFSAVIYLAAIAGIDQELYDAAMIDGAGRYKCAIHITVPGILPTFFVQMVLNISYFFASGMDYPLIFANPLTNPKLEN
ncbi:MAG TPA: ABC transporter permease, partial [Clostridiales bacterium]|nr:ABC transporter permease [Clostridiales bacterium]